MSTIPRVLAIDASRANAPQKTGTEWYAYQLIQELKLIVPKDVHVVLYSREPLTGALAALPANWESRVLHWPPKFLWTQVRLSLEMLLRPPDALFVPVHVLPLAMPKRVAVTLHDVAFVVEPETYSWFERWYQRFAMRLAGRRADIIFTVSDFSRQEIVKYFAVPEKKIAVTPLAHDAAKFVAVESAGVLGRYRIHKPYLLFVGRLERKKNLVGLLRAFQLLKDSGSDEDQIMLVLVGKRGFGYDEAMAAMKGWYGLRYVLELGYVAQADLPAIYASASAFVFPSFYEGFGIPVLEAFGAGVPVIASTTGALLEVAGDAAAYADPRDPAAMAATMKRVLHDATLHTSLRERGVARAKLFNWRRTAELTWEKLAGLLEK